MRCKFAHGPWLMVHVQQNYIYYRNNIPKILFVRNSRFIFAFRFPCYFSSLLLQSNTSCWLVTADITIVTMTINSLYRYVHCTFLHLYILYFRNNFQFNSAMFPFDIIWCVAIFLFLFPVPVHFMYRHPLTISQFEVYFAIPYCVIAHEFTSFAVQIFHFMEFEMCKIYDPVCQSNNKHSFRGNLEFSICLKLQMKLSEWWMVAGNGNILCYFASCSSICCDLIPFHCFHLRYFSIFLEKKVNAASMSVGWI